MSRGYRGLIAAIVLVCASLTVGLLGIESRSNDNQARQCSSVGAQNCRPKAIIIQTRKIANRGDAEQPQYGKNSKFDLDVRSVEAAEQSALWTKNSVYVGGVGIIFVLLTLAANAFATILMHKDFTANNRPKIRFHTCELDTFGGNVPLVFKMTFINVGGSKAWIVQHNFAMIYREGDSQKDYGPVIVSDQWPPHEPSTEFGIDISTEFKLTQAQCRAIDNGTAKLFLDMTTHFRDGNRTMRFSDAIRQYDRKRRKFLKVTAEHEYAKEDFEG